jgi:hypothetical protein
MLVPEENMDWLRNQLGRRRRAAAGRYSVAGHPILV